MQKVLKSLKTNRYVMFRFPNFKEQLTKYGTEYGLKINIVSKCAEKHSLSFLSSVFDYKFLWVCIHIVITECKYEPWHLQYAVKQFVEPIPAFLVKVRYIPVESIRIKL